jgi:hypothetical protein
MLRLFGILVRLAFGLQVAIIIAVATGIALINEALSGRQARRSRAQASQSRTGQLLSFQLPRR